MTKSGAGPVISAESLQCRSVMPTKRCFSSRDVGWTSLLVDVHTGVSSNDPYTAVVTPDPRVGVSLSGRYSAEYFYKGRWRRDVHSPGSICVHRTGEIARWRYPEPKDDDYRAALIYFPLAQLSSAVDHLRRAGRRSTLPLFNALVGRDPAITHMAFALVRAMEEGVDDLYAATVASWLAVHTLTRWGSYAKLEDRRSGGLSDARLSRVVEYISSHFHEAVTLDRLAAEACVSKYHFVGLFRRHVGQTPYRFLTDVRLEAAARMLVTSELAIADVARACGFVRISHFSTAFRRKYGVTPTAFRTIR
jgi:AraC family transcriptional regulator